MHVLRGRPKGPPGKRPIIDMDGGGPAGSIRQPLSSLYPLGKPQQKEPRS